MELRRILAVGAAVIAGLAAGGVTAGSILLLPAAVAVLALAVAA
jgi:hypothetical protein